MEYGEHSKTILWTFQSLTVWTHGFSKHSEIVPCIFYMKTCKMYSLGTFPTHTIRIKKEHNKYEKYVQSMRQECFNGTFWEHVYILLRNDHTKHSANVSCIFLMKTFKIYFLRTFQAHTMKIKKDNHKKYVQSMRQGFYRTFREHVYILLRNDHTKPSKNIPSIPLGNTLKCLLWKHSRHILNE